MLTMKNILSKLRQFLSCDVCVMVYEYNCSPFVSLHRIYLISGLICRCVIFILPCCCSACNFSLYYFLLPSTWVAKSDFI